MHRAFQAAIHPRQFVVFGLRLKPLTLGHVFLLLRAQSPFLVHGRIDPAHVSDAAFICSQDWKQSARDAEAWWFRLWCLFWGFLNRKRDIEAEAKKLSEYFDEHLSPPPVSYKLDRPSRNLESPWAFRHLAGLRATFGMSEDEALSYPIARAIALIVAHGEADDRLKLASQEDIDFAQWCEQQDRGLSE